MKPILILFDVDGTLIETGGAGRKALIAAFRELSGDDGLEQAAATVPFQGKTDPVIFCDIAAAVGLERAEFAAGLEQFWPRYLLHLERFMRDPALQRATLPGVRELVERLDARDDAYLGLLTGNIERGARTKLEAFGLNRFFPDGGFASDSHDRREIARLAHRKLSRRHGISFDPATTVVVGDTRHDVDCGKANGFRTVAIDSGWVPRAELEQAAPDVLLDTFTDLSRAVEALGLNPEE